MTDEKAKPDRPDIKALIKKTAKETRQMFETTIMAPVVPGCRVRVRINGFLSEFEIDDKTFLGWGLLKPDGPGKAKLLQEASPAQIKNYMELLPRFRMIMLKEVRGAWWGLPAQGEEERLGLMQPVPIRLTARTLAFDTALVRFDGASFWFESVFRRRNPSVAKTLRDRLAAEVFPEDVECAEMTPQERLAYSFMFYEQYPELLQVEPQSQTPETGSTVVENSFDYDAWLKDFKAMREILEGEREMTKLKKALHHAGAGLRSYWRNSPADRDLTVNMVVDGKEHVVRVNFSDLTVTNAGICLSGQDANFDLTSFVGVLREWRR